MLRNWFLTSVLAMLLPATVSMACYSGEDEENNDNGITSYPYICPTNDTRDNLQMLTDDFYSPKSSVAAPVENKDDGMPKFDNPEARFVSNSRGTKDFIAAVKGAAGLNDAERAKLIQARMTMPSSNPLKVPAEVSEVSSAVGKQYVNYLTGAAAFYNGEFDAAAQQFAALHSSDQSWLREASRYMTARVDLNRAQVNLFDAMGDMSSPSKESLDAMAKSESAFLAYIKEYPHGLYTASARGLLRKLYWMSKQSDKLINEYDQAFVNNQSNVSLRDLIYEIDSKLSNEDLARSKSPLLLAMHDLKSMRAGEDGKSHFELTKLEAQKSLFTKTHQSLIDYLMAVQAFYVQKDPSRSLALLPKDIPQHGPLNHLSFSKQMLRGLAMEELHDKSAQALWLKLVALATSNQRGTVEAQLVANYQRNNQIAEIFTSSSPIQSYELRKSILRSAADAKLLRQQSQAASASEEERYLALSTLLYKELTRGQFQAFVEDLKLMPKNSLTVTSKNEKYTELAERKAELDLFNFTGSNSNYPCGSIQQIAAALAKNSQDLHALSCLAEFGFLKGVFDGGDLSKKIPADPRDAIPGKPLARGEIYKMVIANPRATKEQRSYALYRAINCYGPSGGNQCGGTDVEKAERARWFNDLKKNYADTRWAGELKYYW